MDDVVIVISGISFKWNAKSDESAAWGREFGNRAKWEGGIRQMPGEYYYCT